MLTVFKTARAAGNVIVGFSIMLSIVAPVPVAALAVCQQHPLPSVGLHDAGYGFRLRTASAAVRITRDGSHGLPSSCRSAG